MAAMVEAQLRSLVQQLAPGRATVKVSHNSPGVVAIEVLPESPSAAPIVANVENDSGLLTLVFGKGSVFEMPHRRPDRELEDEVSALCAAVVLAPPLPPLVPCPCGVPPIATAALRGPSPQSHR